MSGESTKKQTAGPESLDRVFGERAACNRCTTVTTDYRVVALFLHETAFVRAYCRACYPAAADGDYHAEGDGVELGYDTFAARFGAPGPHPPATSPVDRALTRLLEDPALRSLSPASEAVARRRRLTPYRFQIGVRLGNESRRCELTLSPAGAIEALEGDPEACAKVKPIVAADNLRG